MYGIPTVGATERNEEKRTPAFASAYESDVIFAHSMTDSDGGVLIGIIEKSTL